MLIMAILSVLLLTAFAPMFSTSPQVDEPTDPVMIWVIGLVASAIAYGVNYYQRKGGTKLTKRTLTIVLYGIALVLAVLFGTFAWPAFPGLPTFPTDPITFMSVLLTFIGAILAWLGECLTLLTYVVGTSVGPYNLLYEKVFSNIAPLPELMPASG